MICMSLVCHSYVTRIYSHISSVFHMTSHNICMWFVCTHMSLLYVFMPSVYQLYILVCRPYVTCVYFYVIRVSLMYTLISSICHTYVLACHPCVTCIYSYVIRMSPVYTYMSSVCCSYVVLPRTNFNGKKYKDVMNVF